MWQTGNAILENKGHVISQALIVLYKHNSVFKYNGVYHTDILIYHSALIQFKKPQIVDSCSDLFTNGQYCYGKFPKLKKQTPEQSYFGYFPTQKYPRTECSM